jgi:hypothetical protein
VTRRIGAVAGGQIDANQFDSAVDVITSQSEGVLQGLGSTRCVSQLLAKIGREKPEGLLRRIERQTFIDVIRGVRQIVLVKSHSAEFFRRRRVPGAQFAGTDQSPFGGPEVSALIL